MVVPFPPGGGELFARTVSLPFSETLHEKVVIFNRPGAGGNIGTSQVVKARPDGTTVGYVTNGIMCVNSHLYDRQAFDPLKDLEPVAGLTSIGLVLAVSPKALPDVRSAADLVKLAISRPGEIAFASAARARRAISRAFFSSAKPGSTSTTFPMRAVPPPSRKCSQGACPSSLT